MARDEPCDPGAEWLLQPRGARPPAQWRGAQGGGGRGAQCNPSSRAVILLRNSLARAVRAHPAALPAHLPGKSRASPRPRQPSDCAGSTESTPRAGARRRNTWRPGFPGIGRTWLSHLARPRLAPLPPHTRLRPLPSPTSVACPKTPTFAPSYPIRLSPKSPPTRSRCRHPREGRRPDVRPVAKGNQRE